VLLAMMTAPPGVMVVTWSHQNTRGIKSLGSRCGFSRPSYSTKPANLYGCHSASTPCLSDTETAGHLRMAALSYRWDVLLVMGPREAARALKGRHHQADQPHDLRGTRDSDHLARDVALSSSLLAKKRHLLPFFYDGHVPDGDITTLQLIQS
jgi:hypothetical protein